MQAIDNYGVDIWDNKTTSLHSPRRKLGNKPSTGISIHQREPTEPFSTWTIQTTNSKQCSPVTGEGGDTRENLVDQRSPRKENRVKHTPSRNLGEGRTQFRTPVEVRANKIMQSYGNIWPQRKPGCQRLPRTVNRVTKPPAEPELPVSTAIR